MLQHGNPLVAFLHVKIAQILIAHNRIPDTLFAQMVTAKADPLGTKFRLRLQQRTEGRGEGADPSGGLGADDPLRGNVQHTDVIGGQTGFLRQDLIQHRRVGMLSRHDQFSLLLVTLFQGNGIFICGKLSAHSFLLFPRTHVPCAKAHTFQSISLS